MEIKDENYLELTPGYTKMDIFDSYLMSTIIPRPIALASTISEEAVVNLAPYSFFNVFSSNPPILILSATNKKVDNSEKHTWLNIQKVPEIVINSVSASMIHQMNISGCDYPHHISEFEKSGLTPIASCLVTPPRVLESMIQMECKVTETKSLGNIPGSGNLIFCEILKIHIKKSCLDENNQIDYDQLDQVGRLGRMWYCKTSGESKFKVSGPNKNLSIGIDALPEFLRKSNILSGNDLGLLAMIEQLPSEIFIDKWWQSNKEKYSIMNDEDLNREVKHLLSNNEAETALFLLLATNTHSTFKTLK